MNTGMMPTVTDFEVAPVHESVMTAALLMAPVCAFPLHIGAVFAGIDLEKTPAGFDVIEQAVPAPEISPVTLQVIVLEAPFCTRGGLALRDMAGGIGTQAPLVFLV